MTYYELLGISPGATDEQIRLAYENKIAWLKSEQPNGSMTGESISAVEKAYSILGNETSRGLYDNLLNDELSRKEASEHQQEVTEYHKEVNRDREEAAKQGIDTSEHFAPVGQIIAIISGLFFLALGLLGLYAAARGLLTGATWEISKHPRFGGVVSMRNDPWRFWFAVAVSSCVGLSFAGFSIMAFISLFRQSSDDT